MTKQELLNEVYRALEQIPDEKGLKRCNLILKVVGYLQAIENIDKKTEEAYAQKIQELTKELNSFKGVDEEGKVVDLPTEAGDKE